MGDKLGMAESSYSRIESGEIAISYAHLVAISEAFGMSIPELLAYPASNNTNGKTCTERKNFPTKIMVELEIDEGELIKVRLKDNIYQISLPELNKSGEYKFDVYINNNQIETNVVFNAKKEGMQQNDLF